jgi:signal transduction histidine kinase
MEAGVSEVLEEIIPDRQRGEHRVFPTTKTPLRDPDGAVVGIIGISRDITERRAREEALHRAKEEAECANLANKFLAAASHDLRQPLQSLILFAGVLKGYVQGPRGVLALKQLEHGLGALKALLDSLLDVSQLDAGIVKPEITNFPVSAMLDEIAASYAPLASAKGLGLPVESCTDGVRSDMTLLGRVLRNLVENAVRYPKTGHIRIVCRQVDDRLWIDVEDSGSGIPPSILTMFSTSSTKWAIRRVIATKGLVSAWRSSDASSTYWDIGSRPDHGRARVLSSASNCRSP